jgi:predicted nucleotidyltransferase
MLVHARPSECGIELDEGDDVLDLNAVDLSDLADALEDHSYEHSWWLDPKTGEVVLWSDWTEEQGEQDPESRGLRPIEPLASHDAYGDMQDFIDRVHDHRARELLDRAIQGRGAFRRFKDTLLDFPELREAWFRFHDVRMERRAIEWLCDGGLVEPAVAEQSLAERADPEPPELSGAFDPYAIARALSEDLRELYGNRLKRVLLFGSWARGDAHPESDVDLLVVLDRVESPWEELRRMADILDRHSVDNDTVVTALVVAERDVAQPASPVVIRASVEGRGVE